MRALEVNNVSIRYITGDFKEIGLKEYLLKRITGKYKVSEFWAVKDVSFSVERGDMLGIIGTNGAGKSTLLKAVSGIMQPTRGEAVCNGKTQHFLSLDQALTAISPSKKTHFCAAHCSATRGIL